MDDVQNNAVKVACEVIGWGIDHIAMSNALRAADVARTVPPEEVKSVLVAYIAGSSGVGPVGNPAEHYLLTACDAAKSLRAAGFTIIRSLGDDNG